MSSRTSEPSHLTEIDADDTEVYAVAFTANSQCLISGGNRGVRVWQVKDGKQVVTMQVTGCVHCVAVSKDGRWIAAGSWLGQVLVWDATTYEQVCAFKRSTIWPILDVDFSPDSSRLVSADSTNHTATIWDIVARQKVHTFDHSDLVVAAKYSPQGDRIATAIPGSVRVWDSNDGRLLVDIKVGVEPWCGLHWFNLNHLFVKTEDSRIKQINASTGSTVSEWSVPQHTDHTPCIALPQHRKFIAYSTTDNITFWSTSTHTQLGFIPQRHDKCSIACSPDDQLLAILGQNGKVIIKNLSFITDLGIPVDRAVLDSWQNNQLADAEALLTAAIPTSEDTVHHVRASRALVRARLQQWDAALVDAQESIRIQPSVIGYVAKFVALIGKGKMRKGYRVWDIALQRFHSDHVALLLLIKAVVLFMAGEHDDAMSRIDDLITATFSESSFYVVQAYMYLLLGNLHMESSDYQRAIESYENARDTLDGLVHQPPLIISLISGWRFDDLPITIQQRLCEALYMSGRTKETSECLLRMMKQYHHMIRPITSWICDFMQQCLSPANNGDASWVTARHDNVSHPMVPLLREWARLRLTTGSWKDAMATAVGFVLPRSTIYQVICARLEMTGRVMDAVACVHQMCGEQTQRIDGEQANWTQGFKSRCCRQLEDLGDSSMNARQYDEAILQYTIALSLNPATPQDLLVKRSKAHAGKGDWEGALNDANEVIRLNPSSPLGYESKHKALRGAGYHGDAIDAFEMMLSKMSESSDPVIREQFRRYVRPEQTTDAIRTTIKNVIRDSPVVLISAISGRLCDKTEQAAAFESMPVFTELISSMTTQIDHALIKRVVEEFYRYTTFSHTWEDKEPLFEKVTQILVYDLEASPTHDKLQMFCKIVQEAGFNWAWSDTCCINKGDHFVLQEALVSMFKWYEGSAMTIIFLRGVDRLAQRGAMMRSTWNTRGWTLQEYHASKVVRFYTEDWTPYLGLDIYNHKDSPEIISEMEEATSMSAQALMTLRPGLDNIREKLHLASPRQTTRVEDAAYSLFGIFSVSLPVIYGEGDKALGRLLAQLLATSGDTSILVWTGRSGSFNSCLPADITVFTQLLTSHIPSARAELRTITAGLHSLNLTVAMEMYDRLNELPVPSFSGYRMKLPCLTFKLALVSAIQNGSERVFRAQTAALGIVDIKTKEDLSLLGSLYLIHPWIDFLLERRPVWNVAGMTTEKNIDDKSSVLGELPSFDGPSNIASTTRQTRTARLIDRLGRTFGGRTLTESSPDTAHLSFPSTLSPKEKQMRVLQFITRLRQPFGALLLTRTRQNMEEYRRVSTESLIRVQIEEITPAILDKLMNSIRVLDVL